MIKPLDSSRITLQDIRRCKTGSVFFNALINVRKFVDGERELPGNDDDEEEEYA